MATLTPTVGIGASAGGLEALKEFVRAIDPESGFCFVVIQHLAARQPSMMDRLLQESCAIPVSVIRPGDVLTPNRLFLNPPGQLVQLDGLTFVLDEVAEVGALRDPINRFFTSLAESLGAETYSVVLSGAGTDGTSGIKAVKKAGGVVIAQASQTAQFAGMPNSAVSTGLTDFVLSPAEIPGKLANLRTFRETSLAPRLEGSERDAVQRALPQVVELLSTAGQSDFSGYKTGTLTRRITRRMGLNQHETAASYLEHLHRSPGERRALAQDFLVGVTRFFRDPESYRAIQQQVLPALVERPQDHLRIWVPGCSTGEEAYSIAILLSNFIETTGAAKTFQIFGTDVDLEALRVARQGVYSDETLEAITPRDRETYIEEVQDQLRIRSVLREQCLFAPHNILSDPPFSRIDFISCKNLLIYLNEEAHAVVMPRLHYALNTAGYLVLGPSETVGFDEDLFLSIDRRNCLFQRNDAAQTRFSVLHTNPTPLRDRYPEVYGAPEVPAPRSYARSLEGEIERQFVQLAAGAFLAVDGDDLIVYLSQAMGTYVQTARGAIQRTVDHMLASELHLPVRNAVAESRRSGRASIFRDVVLSGAFEPQVVDVIATPAEKPERCVLVEIRGVRILNAERPTEEYLDLTRREADLADKRLRVLEENYLASERQLRSANEKLLSMNEELQSSNEELDTSREELQSINEELETINAELTTTNADLTQSLSDMHNLLESTDLAVLFLDQSLCVRLFTPQTERLFRIRDRDVGRPISDLTHDLDYPEMLNDLHRVIRTSKPRSREVGTVRNDRVYEARVRPYKTLENVADGCVVTFVDVSESRMAAAKAQSLAETIERQYAELDALDQDAPFGLGLLDLQFRWLRINRGLAEVYGSEPSRMLAQSFPATLPMAFAPMRPHLEAVRDTGEKQLGKELRLPTGDGDERIFLSDYYGVETGGRRFGIVCCLREVTIERKLQSQLALESKRLAESEARLSRLFDQAPVAIAVHAGRSHAYVYNNTASDRIVRREVQGKGLLEAFPELEGHDVLDRFDEVYRTGESRMYHDVVARLDPRGAGSEEKLTPVNISLTMQPWFEGDGSVGGVMTFAFDTSEIHRASETNKLLVQELRHRVKNLLTAVQAIAYFTAEHTGSVDDFNEKFFDRLEAIARVNDHLVSFEAQARTLEDILDEELQRLGPALSARVRRKGSSLALPASKVPPLSLAVHELTTNALKYGALSGDDGEVRVEWEREPAGPTVTFRWSETGGRPPAADRTPGFGSKLLNDIVRDTLHGDASLDFNTKGIHYTLSFDLEETST
ncbi:MAG: CheR family methyltransferase [Myxococcota bacterium]